MQMCKDLIKKYFLKVVLKKLILIKSKKTIGCVPIKTPTFLPSKGVRKKTQSSLSFQSTWGFFYLGKH